MRLALTSERVGGNRISAVREPQVVRHIANGAITGTLFTTEKQPQPARKQWLASLLYPKGQLILDAGAVKGVSKAGRSLLPVGVTAVTGDFLRGDLVRCVDSDGEEIARGLSNYSSADAKKLLGRASADIEAILGFGGEEELIHRDNLITTR